MNILRSEPLCRKVLKHLRYQSDAVLVLAFGAKQIPCIYATREKSVALLKKKGNAIIGFVGVNGLNIAMKC